MQTMIEQVLATDPGLEAFFLSRLADRVRRQVRATTAHERSTLGLATFSTFLDCLDLGLEAQARGIIGRGQMLAA